MFPFLKQHTVAIALLFHVIGVLGILSPFRDQFVLLTPFNLLLTFSLLMVHFEQSWQLWLVALLAFGVGFGVEVAGVATGEIFGEYFYGKALGPKVFEVPLTIGLNWAMLLLITLAFAHFLGSNFWLKSAVGAACMTLLDAFIEPIAPLLDFWYWDTNSAPLQNFVAWFLVAFMLHLAANLLIKNQTNAKAIYLYYIQLAFFIVLNITI